MKKYDWLYNEKAPKILVSALKYLGLKEIPGKENNPIIMDWAKELGYQSIFTSDEVAWCGLAMAKVVKDAGYDHVKQPYRAVNWKNFGWDSVDPMLGDILVFKRSGGHHVSVYCAEDDECYHVAGGNQSNAFNIMRIEKTRLIACRRPNFKIGQPANVRKIFLDSKGEISQNES